MIEYPKCPNCGSNMKEPEEGAGFIECPTCHPLTEDPTPSTGGECQKDTDLKCTECGHVMSNHMRAYGGNHCLVPGCSCVGFAQNFCSPAPISEGTPAAGPWCYDMEKAPKGEYVLLLRPDMVPDYGKFLGNGPFTSHRYGINERANPIAWAPIFAPRSKP
jgi:DNA-directed RNA polymerase subunit RPC12/RpoP